MGNFFNLYFLFFNSYYLYIKKILQMINIYIKLYYIILFTFSWISYLISCNSLSFFKTIYLCSLWLSSNSSLSFLNSYFYFLFCSSKSSSSCSNYFFSFNKFSIFSEDFLLTFINLSFSEITKINLVKALFYTSLNFSISRSFLFSFCLISINYFSIILISLSVFTNFS